MICAQYSAASARGNLAWVESACACVERSRTFLPRSDCCVSYCCSFSLLSTPKFDCCNFPLLSNFHCCDINKSLKYYCPPINDDIVDDNYILSASVCCDKSEVCDSMKCR